MSSTKLKAHLEPSRHSYRTCQFFTRLFFDSDNRSIALLLLLYTFQGIPIGLAASIPFLMQSSVSYAQQSIFSFVSLPFSLKLLWAPLVDCLYIPRMGRRKTWLVPVQLISGAIMIYGGSESGVNDWIGMGDASPDVMKLLAFFGILYFLMATQDIAVDGWSLTMLSSKSLGYASTCNAIGQTSGYLISYVIFLALNDADISNKYFRRVPEPYGIVTLGSFLRIWGIIFVVVTMLIAIFKNDDIEGYDPREFQGNETEMVNLGKSSLEASSVELMSPSSRRQCSNTRTHTEESESKGIPLKETGSLTHSICISDSEKQSLIPDPFSHYTPQSIAESYLWLWKIICKPPVRILMLILLTCRVAFAVTDSATYLKLVEYGLPKESLAMMILPLTIIGIISPIFITKLNKSTDKLFLFNIGFPLRMAVSAIFSVFLWVVQSIFEPTQDGQPLKDPTLSAWFYISLYGIIAIYSLCSDLMFVSQMSFFAQISDPIVGGTYMTFLNSVANLGGKWPNALVLWMMDFLHLNRCNEVWSFGKSGSAGCITVIDSYHIVAALCFSFGLFWMFFSRKYMKKLGEFEAPMWRLYGIRPPKTS